MDGFGLLPDCHRRFRTWNKKTRKLGSHFNWSVRADFDDRPTDAARKVAAEIRREACLPPSGPTGRPLPLVSHWNVGTVRGSFEPDHQISLIQQGHYVMPWMSWPQGDPNSERFRVYYERLLRYFAVLDLPISMRGTQWNAMLVGKTYRDGPVANWAGVIAPDGSRVRKLSPFGPLEHVASRRGAECAAYP